MIDGETNVSYVGCVIRVEVCLRFRVKDQAVLYHAQESAPPLRDAFEFAPAVSWG
jgi:hypothetical protein